MNGQEASVETAQLLDSFLRAPSEPESQRLLGELLARHAEPISRGILRSKLRDFSQSQDAEDLGSEVRLKLLKQLSQLRGNGNQNPIRDFGRYVAVVTYHTWDEYLRQKYPQRARLKNRLRYFLTHRRDFALWEGEQHQWLCSFAAAEKGRGGASGKPEPLGNLAASILRGAGRPVELDRLVGMVAELWGIKDQTVAGDLDEAIPISQPERLNRVEQRLYLERLWAEIGKLPSRQRAAILLNLRDAQGSSAVELFHLLGVVSLRGMAEVLEMSAERFAELWKDLPLEDAAIAELLGITRQQVINLRKAGRERLRRWVKRHGS